MPQLLGQILKISLTFAVLLLWESKIEPVRAQGIPAFGLAERQRVNTVSGSESQNHTANSVTFPFDLERRILTQRIVQSIVRDELDRGLLEQINRYDYNDSIYQINSVDRLRDVSSDDWAYEALRSLVERYNCLAGYEDFTFRGNLPLSRYEFAASLNSCLNRLENLIVNSENVLRDDIELLLRLQQDFQADLAVLQGRTDGLEARARELEVTQFSTTTKLLGEAVFAMGGILAGEGDESFVFGDRLRLELTTSFNGRDLLFSRLSAGNFPSFETETGAFAGNLAFAQPGNNDLDLEVLFYNFGIGENTNVIVGAAGVAADDLAGTVNFLDGDGGSGAISAFGTRNPIYLPPGDAGLGIIYRPVEAIEISAGYLASDADNPDAGNGLFDGAFSAIGQILFAPTDNFSFAATYVHGYNQSDTGTGSNLANLRSLSEDLFGEAVPTVSDAYGVELSWFLSDRVVVGGWGALSKVTTLSTLGGQIDRGTQDIWNWAATLALTDLGKQGNVGGFIVGMEPYVESSDLETLGEDEDTSLHLEAFYQYQINKNIAVTPGVVWITAPNSDNNNEDLVIGTIRTTFSF